MEVEEVKSYFFQPLVVLFEVHGYSNCHQPTKGILKEFCKYTNIEEGHNTNFLNNNKKKSVCKDRSISQRSKKTTTSINKPTKKVNIYKTHRETRSIHHTTKRSTTSDVSKTPSLSIIDYEQKNDHHLPTASAKNPNQVIGMIDQINHNKRD